MPSGKKDIYGVKSKRLADPKDIRAEMGAERNAAAAARLAGRKPDAAKILAREGTTNASGGRPAVKMPAKPAAPKQAVIRTTTAYKPTPTGKKK
jgi:hypothetical protein